ncbi:MAG: hypothetical protein OEV44_01385 [Spirochaetota bacterium]|nr:hypothetical protein [Spirochaetota bacterium]
MATFEDIKEVRLRIDDPEGFIDILEVATTLLLPSDPAPQTCYKVTANGNYYSTTKTTGATSADYTVLPLLISDARISAWIDDKGISYASCNSLKQIIARLSKDYQIKRSVTGSESTEFTSLKDMLDYYHSLLDMCQAEYDKENKNSSGKWGSSKPVIITGQGCDPGIFY